MNIDDRLARLEARALPKWCPVLTISSEPGHWDEAVEKALAEAPVPPRGCGYLIVPATLTGAEWTAAAEAEMALVADKFSTNEETQHD